LSWHSVHLADLVTPVSAANRDNRHLGLDNCTTDGSGHLLSTLDTQANVAVVVANDNESLEAGALTSARLLLHWHNLHHLVLQCGAQEVLHNLVLLNGHREQVDLLQRLNLALLDEAAKLCAGHPLLLVLLLATSTASTTATAAVTTPTETTAKAATLTAAISHVLVF
ncbi:hypothetical protein Vretifemale_18790, partial [Volvox reticuliferus]